MKQKDAQRTYNKDYYILGRKSGYDDYYQQNEEILDSFWMKYIARYSKHSPNKKHLDIGCAFGGTVNRMKQNEWDSSGIDISEYAINEGKKIYKLDA